MMGIANVVLFLLCTFGARAGDPLGVVPLPALSGSTSLIGLLSAAPTPSTATHPDGPDRIFADFPGIEFDVKVEKPAKVDICCKEGCKYCFDQSCPCERFDDTLRPIQQYNVCCPGRIVGRDENGTMVGAYHYTESGKVETLFFLNLKKFPHVIS
ncbi:hypothetical protein B0H63DRAFT_534927 [Podospora didyma]|uniref:Uncharacterized protein n=1 Tax=Podospora didyma TaxID=330526 RepID=A0AAE0K2Y8_9PEZI|nr:hypothetical protein B0H63DRAFT_534927 [Podospora didyma]